jgi:hypothetical protein
MPEVEDRVSDNAKDRSPVSAFNDTAMVSVAFLAKTDGSGHFYDVAMQASKLLE